MEAVRLFLEDAGYVIGLAAGAVALAALAHGLIVLVRRPWRRVRPRPTKPAG